MGRILYYTLDTLIVLICIPFYLVAIPLMMLYQYFSQRRKVYLNLEITHWPARDLREDYLIVDVSRIEEGLVGIRKRCWCVMRSGRAKPPYSDEVEFISVKKFWVPNPFTLRSSSR
jgi:hypothetical protein